MYFTFVLVPRQHGNQNPTKDRKYHYLRSFCFFTHQYQLIYFNKNENNTVNKISS